MQRISTSSKAAGLFGPGKDGFKNGDLGLGIAPTAFEAAWCNNVQEELLSVIEATGLTANGATLNQLLLALRRAGAFRAILQVNSTQVLPVSAFNATVQAYGAGPITLTIPATGDILPGTQIVFGNYAGSGLVTIASSTANMSTNGIAASVASIILGFGETIILVWTGTSWVVIGGSAQLRYTAGFASSLTTNGWKRYSDPNSPTGYFVEQWGIVAVSIPAANTQYDMAINFPVAFSTACLDVAVTLANVNLFYQGYSAEQLTATGFRLFYAQGGASVCNVRWRAKGY